MIEGLLIVPTRETKNFRKLYDLVEHLTPSSIQNFKIGKSSNSSLGMDELTDKYSTKAIKKAKEIGRKIGANLAFLYYKRGFGELEVSAHYFLLK